MKFMLMPVNKSSVRRAFTLIELLVVISIIGLLAAMTFSVTQGVARTQKIKRAQAELNAIVTAIDRYHAAYGVYPPCNPTNYLVNPLYFELEGATNRGTVTYTLDGMNSVVNTGLPKSLGVGGFVNSSRGSGDDMVAAKMFLPDLKATQIGVATNTAYPAGADNPGVAILITSVGGPDAAYRPLGLSDLNPWRYNSSNPTNNPGSYDLYVQLVINGKTNLICNWSKQVQINASFP